MGSQVRPLRVVLRCGDLPLRREVLEALAGDVAVDIKVEQVTSGLQREHSDPDVLILDESCALLLVDKLSSAAAQCGVVVVAYAPSRLCGALLLTRGVSCLAAGSSPWLVRAAVRCAASRTARFTTSDGTAVCHMPEGTLPLLTVREREVLTLLGEDLSYAQLALRLTISVETVRSHAASLRRKFGAKDRQDLVQKSRMVAGGWS